MKKKESNCAIICDPSIGPRFDNCLGFCENYNPNNLYSIIHNDGTNGYECHPVKKSSLYVNTAGSDERNYFSLLDYEVFTHK